MKGFLNNTLRQRTARFSLHPIGLQTNDVFFICSLIFIYVSFFYGLGAYGLLNDNEGLYAEIPREMMETGSYIIPTLDYVPYIEKPPLLYWLIAGSYHLFGISEFSARVVPALFALITTLSLYYLGRRIGRIAIGSKAALILCSSIGFAVLARMILFDMLLTAFIALALLNFFLWYRDHRKRNLLYAYVFVGLGMMSKGLVALVLVGATALIFLLFMRESKARVIALFDPVGITLLLLITAPWHIAASLSDPDFAWFYFINEHVLRFLGDRVPADFRTGPVYYYLPRLAVGFLPWTLLWLVMVVRVKKVFSRRDPLDVLMWIWCLVFLAFFSLSRAKSDYYLVTAMPAMAWLLATYVERQMREGKALGMRNALLAGFGLMVAFIAGFYALRHDTFSGADLRWSQIVTIIAVAGVSCAAMLWFWQRRRSAALFMFAGSSVAITTFSLLSLASLAQDHVSETRLAGVINASNGVRHIYLYRDFEALSSLLFYVKRRIPIVDSASQDLAYGQSRDMNGGSFATMTGLLRRSRGEKLYVVSRERYFSEFAKRTGNAFCRSAEIGKVMVLTNDPTECQGSMPMPMRATVGGSARRTSREAHG